MSTFKGIILTFIACLLGLFIAFHIVEFIEDFDKASYIEACESRGHIFEEDPFPWPSYNYCIDYSPGNLRYVYFYKKDYKWYEVER